MNILEEVAIVIVRNRALGTAVITVNRSTDHARFLLEVLTF